MSRKRTPIQSIVVLGIVIVLGVMAMLLTSKRNAPPPTLPQPASRSTLDKSASNNPLSHTKKPERVESTIKGIILSVGRSGGNEIEFAVADEQRNNKIFQFRLSNRADIVQRTFDPDKEVITIATVVDQTPFSSIKKAKHVEVKTIDPLDAHGPLQALRVTILKPPSKKE